MPEPRSCFEIVAAFAPRNTAHDNRFECPMEISRNKRRKFASAASASSARRRLFSNAGNGMIAPRPMTAGWTDDADGTDAIFSVGTHPDDSRPAPALSGKRDLDAQGA
jgi:hypothetical protein